MRAALRAMRPVAAAIACCAANTTAAGPFPAVLELSDLNGKNGFILTGIAERDFAGYSASGAGDLNGDGIEDIILSAANADPGDRSDAGQSYVVFGGAGIGGAGVIKL